MTNNQKKKIDIIVLGATGYTGKIVCEYLANLKKENEVTWGIAGRNEDKLNELKKELNKDISVFVTDFSDASSLDKVCSSTKLLISCAGPFTLVGMPIVESCVRCGTHYIDSTGEYNFVRLVIERFHEEAKQKGLLLVSCCAFDSTPAEIGNYVTHKAPNIEMKEIYAFYQLSNAGVSSGTARSVMALREGCTPEDMDKYSLLPKDAPRPTKSSTRKGMWYDFTQKKLTGPFVMAATNERVVARTNALLGYHNSHYVEASEGNIREIMLGTLTMYALWAITSVSFLRRYIVNNLLPPAGSGPTQAQKEQAHYKCIFIGIDKEGKCRRRVYLSDKRDMYTASGLYICESALSALQMIKEGTLGSGVLTPMSAFGDILLHRVQKAGVVVEVVDEPTETTATSSQN